METTLFPNKGEFCSPWTVHLALATDFACLTFTCLVPTATSVSGHWHKTHRSAVPAWGGLLILKGRFLERD